ncbi:hypothetical protein FRC14_002535 [Serendipita sp. 396]|nr:hypothetical protein FRC14_002535 [Serendipita sp. 396]
MDPGGYGPWYTAISFNQNNENCQEIFTWTREALEMERKSSAQNIIGFAYALPLAGIQLFLCFGLGSEVRKSYMKWVKALRTLVLRPARMLAEPLKSLARNIKLWRGLVWMDPNNFVPFCTAEIALEDLTVPWNHAISPTNEGMSAPSSAIPLPNLPSNTSKRYQGNLIPPIPPRVFRKDRIPTTICERERDGNAKGQNEAFSKTRNIPTRPDYVVYRKNSL